MSHYSTIRSCGHDFGLYWYVASLTSIFLQFFLPEDIQGHFKVQCHFHSIQASVSVFGMNLTALETLIWRPCCRHVHINTHIHACMHTSHSFSDSILGVNQTRQLSDDQKLGIIMQLVSLPERARIPQSLLRNAECNSSLSVLTLLQILVLSTYIFTSFDWKVDTYPCWRRC